MRHFKIVKANGPADLVYQFVHLGKPTSDGNILKRHIKPVAEKLRLHVNWWCLRTSHTTRLDQEGAEPKSVEGQMRHSRISTTLDVYAQIVPADQRAAVQKLSEFAGKKPVPNLFQRLNYISG